MDIVHAEPVPVSFKTEETPPEADVRQTLAEAEGVRAALLELEK